MSLKIAVIGGGSTYTPELIEGLAVRADVLPVEELVLVDIDPERLEIVGGLAKRIAARHGWEARIVLADDRERALDGADFVVVQLRVGGQSARLSDETLPLKHGSIGQETTGAGGLAKALRTVPVVLDIAEEMESRAASGAWLVDFTNPVGIVTQALLDRGHRAVGLCNVAITLQRRLADRFGVVPDRVELEHVGLNHLSWERQVRVDGRDRLPELLEEDAGWIAAEVGLPVEIVTSLGMVPSYYLRYFYMTDSVLEDQLSGKTRAREVMKIEQDLLDLYKDPALDRKPSLLDERGGAYYSEAAAQLIASLNAGNGDVQIVDVRNEGAIPGLAADAVVEIPTRVDADGAHPVPVGALEPEILGLIEQIKSFERIAVDAATSGSRTMALKALLVHPLVGTYRKASAILDDLLDANREYLPRFFQGATTK